MNIFSHFLADGYGEGFISHCTGFLGGREAQAREVL